jgi:hypothetical protein
MMVFNAVHTVAAPDKAPGGIGATCGQHSMVTAPSVTLPKPVIRNVRKPGSGSVRVKLQTESSGLSSATSRRKSSFLPSFGLLKDEGS